MPTIEAPTLLGHLLTVTEVVRETPNAVSISFAVPDDLRGRFDYQPGQFLTLAIPSDRVARVARCYSLSSSPDVDHDLTVTVKRTANGYASNWLCDNAEPGLQLRILPPAGTFTPKDLSRDLVLAAAGSGVTPVFSILRTALHGVSGHITLIYANRDRESVIFADSIEDLKREHPDRLTVVPWLESEHGLPGEAEIAELLADLADREVFSCGPAPFMDVVTGAAARVGIHPTRIHRESYLSLTGDPFELTAYPDDSDGAPPAEVEVQVDGEVHRLSWPRSRTLMDVLLEAGVDAPYSCREGTCGSCLCSLEQGDVAMDTTEALDEADIADGFVLGCQARPISDRLRVIFE